jgi:PAS domain S-box-containing protein
LYDYFSTRLDYIFFFYGFSFIFLAALCFGLSRNRSDPVPWIWLLIFGISHGVNEWFDMLVISLGDRPIFAMVRLVLMTISFLCLFEFGRAGITTLGGGYSPAWTYIPLICIAASGGFWGISGLNSTVRYAFGFTGTLLTTLLFLQVRKFRYPESRSLIVAAFGMGVYAVATGIIVPYSPFFPASVINATVFFKITTVPIQLVRGICAVVIALAIWQHSCDLIITRYTKRDKEQFRRWATTMIIVLLLVVISGGIVTEMRGNTEDISEKTRLSESAEMIAAALNYPDIKVLNRSPALLSPEYLKVKQSMMDIQASSDQLRWVYLMVLMNGSIVFSVDSIRETDPAYSPPGDTYVDAPPGLIEVFSSGNTRTLGPYTDQWGSFVSSFTPIRDPLTHEIVAVLGLDVNASLWSSIISLNRLETIFVVMFILLLLVVFFVSQNKIRDNSILHAESEEKYRNLVEGSPNVITLFDRTGALISINENGRQKMGIPIPEQGQPGYHDLWTDVSGTSAQDAFDQVLSGQKARFEIAYLHPDGRTIIFDLTLNPLISKDTNIVLFVGIANDVTERVRAMESLRDSEERFNLAIEGTGAGLWDRDLVTGRVVYSSQWKQMLGYEDQEVEDTYAGWKALWHPDDRKRIEKAEQDYLSGITHRFEVVYRLRHKKGNWRWIITRGKIIKNSSGIPYRWVGTNINITDQKQAEEALVTSEARYHSLFEHASIPICEIDFSLVKKIFYELLQSGIPDFRLYFEENPDKVLYCAGLVKILDVNLECMRFLGVTEKKEIPNNFLVFFNDESLPVFKKGLIALAEGNTTFQSEMPIRSLNGEIMHLILHVAVISGFESDLSRVHISFIDITNRKIMEQELAFHRMHLEELVEIRTTELTREIDARIRTEASLRESLLRFHTMADYTYDWEYWTDPDGGFVYMSPSCERVTGYNADEFSQNPNLLFMISHPDDRSFVLDHIIKFEENPGIGNMQYRIVHRNGEVLWIEHLCTQVKSCDGQNLGRRVSNREITDRKRAEDDVQRLLRMRTDLITQMSHDLRTPLTSVLALLPYVKKKIEEPKLLNLLEIVLEDAERMKHLVEMTLDLMFFDSGSQVNTRATSHLLAAVHEAIHIHHLKIEKKGMVIMNTIPDKMFVQMTQLHLTTICSNLIENAVKYSYEQGTITISALLNPDGVLFSVSDDGIGIDPQEIPKIFDEYYKGDQSRHDRDSHGLGLSIVKRTVEAYGGEITVKSRGKGEGTTFTVFFREQMMI